MTNAIIVKPDTDEGSGFVTTEAEAVPSYLEIITLPDGQVLPSVLMYLQPGGAQHLNAMRTLASS